MTAPSESVRERIHAVEGTGMRTFADPDPLVWARTRGTSIWDEDGREYLDLYAGFAVAALGYCDPRVTEAIVAQAPVMTHSTNGSLSAMRAVISSAMRTMAALTCSSV